MPSRRVQTLSLRASASVGASIKSRARTLQAELRQPMGATRGRRDLLKPDAA